LKIPSFFLYSLISRPALRYAALDIETHREFAFMPSFPVNGGYATTCADYANPQLSHLQFLVVLTPLSGPVSGHLLGNLGDGSASDNS
jgi:hypothetical protein